MSDVFADKNTTGSILSDSSDSKTSSIKTDESQNDNDCQEPPPIVVKNRGDIKDLYHAKNIILTRNKVLKCAIKKLKEDTKQADGNGLKLEEDELFFLASTDLFVEKAQLVLTRRGRILIFAGVASILMAVALLTGGFWIGFLPNDVLYSLFLKWGVPVQSQIHTEVYIFAFNVFKAIASSAYIYVSVKIFISLARSFFNEGLSLFERRHALRFGRLYLYLKKGKVSEEWLTEFFQWNKETKTSFLDMKPDVLTETLLHKLVGVFSDLGKLPPEILKAVYKK